MSAASPSRPPYSYRDDPAVPEFPDDKPLIVFDGHCVLCSGWANFVIRHDRARRIRLTAAQSALGRALYVHYGLDPVELESNLLLAEGRVWLKAEGSIRMAQLLGWPWAAARVFRLLPARAADRLYAWIARNRLRWFGARTVCYVARPEDADRFLA